MIDFELKRRLIIIFCYFITLLLILGLIFTFISLIVEKRHSLPIYKTLSEDMEQFNDDSEVDDNIIALKSIEALEKVANGNATKLVLPSDTVKFLGTFKGIKEVLGDSE